MILVAKILNIYIYIFSLPLVVQKLDRRRDSVVQATGTDVSRRDPVLSRTVKSPFQRRGDHLNQ